MTSVRIPIVQKILSANDQMAAQNRQQFSAKGIFTINIMASPGAGKTSVILQTIKALSGKLRLAVIEGDTAPVTIDADKISMAGVPAIQINTGGDCHLDAAMVSDAMKAMQLDDIDLVIIENVGNLVCPASFDLGQHANVLIASVPEGDDKPYKYPAIYRGLHALILNKTDLLPYIPFKAEYFFAGVDALNPGLAKFPMSCMSGEGVDAWVEWITAQVKKHQAR